MFKLRKHKWKIKNLNGGMTYVELIVVLSIFAVMSGVVLFNYGQFQGKVDVKNLASDIALKLVEAQKSSISGILPPIAQQSQIGSNWKPSYGVYFNTNPASENKSFIYFADLNGENGMYDSASCPGSGECLDKLNIGKGNYISNLSVVTPTGANAVTFLSVTFKRPNSSPVIWYGIGINTILASNYSYAQITVTAPSGVSTTIKLYPSGRIQIE